MCIRDRSVLERVFPRIPPKAGGAVICATQFFREGGVLCRVGSGGVRRERKDRPWGRSLLNPLFLTGSSSLAVSYTHLRKYRHLPALSASEFLKLMREKRDIVALDNKLANRSVNEGFSGGEKKRNEIFQMAMLPWFDP